MIDDMKRRLADIDRQLKTKKHLEYFKNLLMKKKLKIKFWKTEKALAMQVIKQEGLPKCKDDGFVNIVSIPAMYKDTIYLRGDCHQGDFNTAGVLFKTNQERDEYLDNIINAITDELFTANTGKLRVGELCEVRDYEHKKWETRRLLAVLPTHIKMPFIVERPNNNAWFEEWRHARPLCKRIEPMIEVNGEIITYTWEE